MTICDTKNPTDRLAGHKEENVLPPERHFLIQETRHEPTRSDQKVEDSQVIST